MQTQADPLARATAPFLERWLQDRRRLISAYCELTSQLRRGHGQGLGAERLRRFRSLLVDYVCAGHFDVYSRLLQDARPAPQAVARLFPQIDLSTEIALAFEDACGDRLPDDALLLRLSDLGEVMETRFAREDVLIRMLRRQEGDAVAA